MTLTEMAVDVPTTADGREKTARSHAHARDWFAAREADATVDIGTATPPTRPARLERPELLHPRDVPKRRPGTPDGRIARVHAVAHIELNAVDLHWDLIARFGHVATPVGYYDDWVKAADEESKHFNLICDCLEEHGSHYGALAARSGMWRAAEDTRRPDGTACGCADGVGGAGTGCDVRDDQNIQIGGRRPNSFRA